MIVESPEPHQVDSLPFTAPNLLAPMEGVTEPCFRGLVTRRNPPSALGGSFTEFVRVSHRALPLRILRAHLGLPPALDGAGGERTSALAAPRIGGAPVGIQLMGPEPESLAETARRAEELGVPLIDLNFGCPAKGALRSCAGSALLDHPDRIEALIAACVKAVERVPISAKIRAGVGDDRRLEQVARAVEAGGASLLTVHCRTRLEGYSGPGDWDRLRRAVTAVSIPVCGNGGVECHADLARLRRETGCALVMVGRAALGNPWIFSGEQVAAAEAARFLLDYARSLGEQAGAPERKVLGRLKQLIQTWRAGGLFGGERPRWLREKQLSVLLDWLELRASG